MWAAFLEVSFLVGRRVIGVGFGGVSLVLDGVRHSFRIGIFVATVDCFDDEMC